MGGPKCLRGQTSWLQELVLSVNPETSDFSWLQKALPFQTKKKKEKAKQNKTSLGDQFFKKTDFLIHEAYARSTSDSCTVCLLFFFMTQHVWD